LIRPRKKRGPSGKVKGTFTMKANKEVTIAQAGNRCAAPWGKKTSAW